MFGLGIIHVGVSSARSLMEYFGSVDDLAKAEVADLLKVQDIGGIVAESIHAWFRDERNVKLLDRLRAAGLLFSNPKVEQASDKFAGTTWVITGTLSQGREEIADIIRANGGKVSGSVSGKTTYLLAGEEAGSKMEKAAKLGVKVLSEEEFGRCCREWRDAKSRFRSAHRDLHPDGRQGLNPVEPALNDLPKFAFHDAPTQSRATPFLDPCDIHLLRGWKRSPTFLL